MSSLQHLFLALPFLGLGACGTGAQGPDSTSVDQALSTSYGGLTEDATEPAASDPDFAEAGMTDEDILVQASATDPSDAAVVRGLRLAVAWGYLRPHPDATEIVDWSGSICATNAALRVLRVLRFEPATDAVIRPRTDKSCVDFTSKTRPRSDGLLLAVVPTADPAATGPITLTFTSAPITDTLTIERGMRGSKIVKVDDAGHVLAYHLARPDQDACKEGFLRGEWNTLATPNGRELGTLRGRWVASDGSIAGFLKGVFGVRKNGKQVFFAKVADKNGDLIGLVAGVYGDGKLAGLFVGRGKIVMGRVHGEYDPGTPGGFIGRWSQKCGEDPGEGQAAAGDEPQLSTGDDLSN